MKATRHTLSILAFCMLAICFASCHKEGEHRVVVPSADTLYFQMHQTQHLVLHNTASQDRTYSVISHPDWVDVYPNSTGSIPAGGEQIFLLESFIDPDDPFENIGELVIGIGISKLRITLIAHKNIPVYIPQALFYHKDQSTNYIMLRNMGDDKLPYTVDTRSPYVTSSFQSGNLLPQSGQGLSITVDRENLNADSHEIAIEIYGQLYTVTLVFDNLEMLEHNVVDAEYNKAADRLVYVADDKTLNIIDTRGNNPHANFSPLELPFKPRCVSISPDGQRAAVGSDDGRVSYINLNAPSYIIRTREVSVDDIGDIILDDRGWVYIFDKRDTWGHVVSLHLSVANSGEMPDSQSFVGGMKGHMVPSGDYIYCTDNLILPPSIKKFDIRYGAAVFIDNSSNHDLPWGTYLGGNVWFNESGGRLFSRGVALTVDEDTYNDMEYIGSFSTPSPNSLNVAWVDHAECNHELYVSIGEASNAPIPNILEPNVYVLDDATLTHKRTIALERTQALNEMGYVVPDNAFPHFVFVNSEGTRLFVLTRANIADTDLHWALQKIDL